jgi:REP element-mobilizing transposase RayT
MRTARLKVPKDHPTGFYHCLSRVVDRQFIFNTAEKEHFLALMRECERFCRVQVLTYALMSNHFHILLAVPQRPASLPEPEEILDDLKRLSGHQFPEAVRQRFAMFREAGDDAGLAAYLETFHRRMYDVSAFMKMLKQRFSQWYNVRKGRKGTLWEERFRSVLVDGAGDALVTMAAYIDLNPIRAGVVKDPKDYRWCGYGEAMAGVGAALEGVQFLAAALQGGREESPAGSLEIYRKHLYLEGDERREGVGPDGRPVRGSLSGEEVAKVLAAKGKLPLSEYLRCRVRYFCDGAVFGGREYVEGIFKEYRKRFGPKRKTGARPMRGLKDAPVYTVRDLRLDVFGGGTQPTSPPPSPAAPESM